MPESRSPRRRRLRLALLTLAVLLLPLLPLVWLHANWEEQILSWLRPELHEGGVFAIVVGILAMDVLLPIPSSMVSTWAGERLGIGLATLASWLGMTAGAILGYALARFCGRPLAARLCSAADMERMQALSERRGALVLVAARALPLLAEASVLWMGVARMPWMQFLVPVALANLGISLAWALLGHYAGQHDSTLLALAASFILPLAISLVLRKSIKAH